MINIDFLVAGCGTRCRHCYVNGGPGPIMPVKDVLLCMERLDALAAYLPDDVTFTLDHEPMNHPQVKQIIRAASQTVHIKNYHHGMTAGAGLPHRKDRREVVRAYFDCGYQDFGITIHGAPAHHDEITRRRGSYEDAVRAGEFLLSEGAELSVSLMLNRFFVEDADHLSHLLKRLQPHFVYFAIPIYTPHRNMRDFEPYRASLENLETLRHYLAAWKQDPEAVLNQAERSTAAAAAAYFTGGHDLPALFAEKQDELYLSLHQDCRLYVGNSGAETQCLGDLRSLDLRAAAESIAALPGNRDYGAFYDTTVLPPEKDLVAALSSLPRDALFGDFPSVIYRGLSELHVPTKIIGQRNPTPGGSQIW